MPVDIKFLFAYSVLHNANSVMIIIDNQAQRKALLNAPSPKRERTLNFIHNDELSSTSSAIGITYRY